MSRLAAPVALTVVLLLGAACATDPGRPGAASSGPASSGPTASTAPTRTYPPYQTANVAPFDLGHIRALPADAAVGTAYPFDLYAHCGIDHVRFGGRSWRSEQRYGDGLPGYVVGTMELLDADTARFVFDRRHFASRVEVVIYHRSADEVPICQ